MLPSFVSFATFAYCFFNKEKNLLENELMTEEEIRELIEKSEEKQFYDYS